VSNHGALLFARWRKRQDLSQEQAATRLGVSVSLLSKLESGKRTPSLALAAAIEAETKIGASTWTKQAEAA